MTSRVLLKVRIILRRFPRARFYLPFLTALGMAATIAESLGISLLVLLLGQYLGGTMPATGGALGQLFDLVQSLIGTDPTAYAALVFGLLLTKIVIGIAYAFLSSSLRHSMSQAVREALFSRYLHMPYARFKSRHIGDLHDAVALHSWSLADACATVARLGSNIGSIIVFTLFVLALSVPAAIIALIGSSLIFGLMAYLNRHAAAMGEASVVASSRLTDRILSDLQAMRTIRAFGRQEWAFRRFGTTSRRAKAEFQKIERLQILLYPITEIGYLSLLALIVAASVALDLPNSATFAAVILLYRMQPQLRELDSNRLTLAGHSASMDRILVLLGRQPKRAVADTISYPGISKGITFAGVTFCHDKKVPILEAASFHIPGRGLTIISGRSGTGKTTVMNMLLRLYDPQVGEILVGGVPLSRIKREDWLSRVGIAGQDIDLMAGTIAQNIRLGRLNASLEELWTAAELAGLASTIEALPDKFETLVGERGLNLSGGQRQRVGLARALVRDPDLLILDEATNSVEHLLEASILKDICRHRAFKPTILITHRPMQLGIEATIIDLQANLPVVAERPYLIRN